MTTAIFKMALISLATLGLVIPTAASAIDQPKYLDSKAYKLDSELTAPVNERARNELLLRQLENLLSRNPDAGIIRVRRVEKRD